MIGTEPVIRYSPDSDVKAVEAMAAALTPYIYEDELYGTLAGSLPRLTLGGLLMRLQRLQAIRNDLSPSQQQILSDAQAKLDAVRKDWAVAYEKKVEREIPVRLQAYAELIKECQEDARNCAETYPSSIEKRVILEVLRADAEGRNVLSANVASQVQNLDAQLRKSITISDFIWDKRLEAAYPRGPYWYLYVKVKR